MGAEDPQEAGGGMHSGVGCLPLRRNSVNSQVSRGLNWGESISEEASTSTRKTRWPAHSSQPRAPRGWLGRGKPEQSCSEGVENAALGHAPAGRERESTNSFAGRQEAAGPRPPSSFGSCWLSDPCLTRATTIVTLIKLPTLHQSPCF